jgi:hypothetical protein
MSDRDAVEVEVVAEGKVARRYPGAPWLQAPPATQPPKEHRHLQHHWLKSERASQPVISEWLGGCWYSAGEVEPISPEEMWRRGWEYHAPAVPPDGWEPK